MINSQIDRWVSVYAVQPLLHSRLLQLRPGIPILMYHSVSNDHEIGIAPYYRVTTSPGRFREQMRYLHDHQFEVIGLPLALSRLTADLPLTARSVVITFDDGLDDFRTHAWPVLSSFGFTATMFLPTGYIGQTSRSFKGRRCLTWTHVRCLHREGVSFGAHTVNHPVLYGMSWVDIRFELQDSRKRVEDELGSPVQSFAYPYAFPQEDRRFVTRLRGELLACGYSDAATTVVGREQKGGHPLSLRRLPINDRDDHRLFVSKLHGAYDWVGGVQGTVKHVSRQIRSLRSGLNRAVLDQPAKL